MLTSPLLRRPLRALCWQDFFVRSRARDPAMGRGMLLLVVAAAKAPDDLSTRGAAVRDDLRRSSKTLGTARR